MGVYSDFIGLVKSLNPSICRLFLLGDLRDHTIHNRGIVVSGSPNWLKKESRFSFAPNLNGRIEITHGSEQVSDQQTIIGFLQPFRYTIGLNYVNLISKRSAVGTYYMVGIDDSGSATRVRMYNGTTFERLTTPVAGMRSLAVTLDSGNPHDVYIDGVFRGNINALTYTSQNVQVNIGSTYTGSNPFGSPIEGVLVFPSLIDPDDIALMCKLFDRLTNVELPKRKPKRTTLKYNPRISISKKKNVNGIIPDDSGYNNHGIVSDNMTFSNDVERCYFETHGQGNGIITIPEDSSWTDSDYNVFTIEINVKTIGEGGSGRVIEKQTGPNSYFTFFIIATNTAVITQSYSDGAAQWTFSIPLQLNLILQIWFHRNDPTVSPRVWINGNEVSVSVLIAKTGSVITDIGSDIVIGNRPGLDRASDCQYSLFNFYVDNLSVDDIKDEYIKLVTNKTLITVNEEYPITFPNASDQAPGKSGPFRLAGSGSSGFWELNNENNKIFRLSTGRPKLYLPCNQVYGAWYFKHKAQGGEQYLYFVSSKNNGLGSGQLGYFVYLSATNNRVNLYRDAGTVVTTGPDNQWTVNVEYEFFITRRQTDGFMRVYMRGGTEHITWDLVVSGTHNVNTTSKYISLDITALNTTISDVYRILEGDSLHPNDIPELAD
jgi:hypothetical protein